MRSFSYKRCSFLVWIAVAIYWSAGSSIILGQESVLPPWMRLWPNYPGTNPKVATSQATATPTKSSPPILQPPPPLPPRELPPWLPQTANTGGSVSDNGSAKPVDSESSPSSSPVIPTQALQTEPVVLNEPLELVPSPPEVTATEVVTGMDIPEVEQTNLLPNTYWRWPLHYFSTGDWSNSAELGINGTEGNSQTMSMVAGLKLKRKTDRDVNDLRLTSQRTNTDGRETQNNTLLYNDYELFLGDGPWSIFVKSGLEYDEFKAFDLRLFVNSGLAYKFVKTKAMTTGVRFGVGTSREFGGPDDRWVPELLFGFDHEHQVNKHNKVSFKLDYYPEWTDFNNYRVVLDASWEYLLDTNGNLSLKLSAVDRYDSTPNGARPNDINYAILLLYRF